MFQEFIHRFGSGLCHQLPERTLGAGAYLFPVCARCSGIYVGFTVALIALLVWYRHDHRPRRFSLAFAVAAVAALALMGWDGVSSYAGLRATSNLVRALTGVAFGASLAVLAYAMVVDVLAAPRADSRVSDESATPMLGTLASFSWWLGSAILAFLVLMFALPVAGPVGPLAVAVATIITFSAFGTVLVGMVPRFTRSASTAAGLIVPLLLGVVAGSGLLAASKIIQALLDGWVVG